MKFATNVLLYKYNYCVIENPKHKTIMQFLGLNITTWRQRMSNKVTTWVQKWQKEKELHTLSTHSNIVSQCQYTFVDQVNQSYKDLVG
jgi:hypothetical protein